jgi:hypothetical protein
MIPHDPMTGCILTPDEGLCLYALVYDPNGKGPGGSQSWASKERMVIHTLFSK